MGWNQEWLPLFNSWVICNYKRFVVTNRYEKKRAKRKKRNLTFRVTCTNFDLNMSSTSKTFSTKYYYSKTLFFSYYLSRIKLLKILEEKLNLFHLWGHYKLKLLWEKKKILKVRIKFIKFRYIYFFLSFFFNSP